MIGKLAELGPRTLLTVQICVSEYQLVVLDRIIDLRYFSPSLCFWPEASFKQFVLVHLQLLEEGRPHLQILPPRVQELERLEHAPPVLSHDVGGDDEARPILRLLALDKDALMVLHSVVHKVEYFVRYFLGFVEEDLLLVVLPVERQVLHPDAIPVVVELHAGGVDYFLYFV